MTNRLKNVHPGEVLLEEFLKPLGISQNKLANDISVTPRRINEIVLGEEVLQLTLLFDWLIILAFRKNFGWDCRMIMSLRKHTIILKIL